MRIVARGEGLDATRAVHRVVYHHTSHFNREYKSLFGLPWMRDMERLRGTAREIVDLSIWLWGVILLSARVLPLIKLCINRHPMLNFGQRQGLF
jgi:hypothetical protein